MDDREKELTEQIEILTAQLKPLWAERKAIRDKRLAEEKEARKARREESDRLFYERIARRYGRENEALLAWESKGKDTRLVRGAVARLVGYCIHPEALATPEALVAALRYKYKNDPSYSPKFDPADFVDEKFVALKSLLAAGGFAITFE